MDLTTLAKTVIENTPCATIASVSPEGMPWSTPVTIAYDEKYNFFWTSMSDTLHSHNITATSTIALSICDTKEIKNETGAVYCTAECIELTNEADIKLAAELLYARKGKPVPPVGAFTGKDGKRLYRAVPHQFWINPGHALGATDESGKVLANTRHEITL